MRMVFASVGFALLSSACGGDVVRGGQATGGASGQSSNGTSERPVSDTGAGGQGASRTPSSVGDHHGERVPAPPIPPFPDRCSNGGQDPHVSQADCTGYCDTDEECGVVPCFQLPGATRGICAFGRLCLNDSHCSLLPGSHCVAVTDSGIRMCNQTNECNQSSDCSPGSLCALPDGSFVGQCTTGQNADLCTRTADCNSGLHCFMSSVEESFDPAANHYGRCSDGHSGAACSEDTNCRTGACIARTCSDGTVHALCLQMSDCQAGLQCVPFNSSTLDYPGLGDCSDGTAASFSQCQTDSQCASGHYCARGILCMDGSEGSLCDLDEQCQSGRCALGGEDKICTSGSPGALCFDAGDCVSGVCERAPGDNNWQLGRCGGQND